MAGKIIFRSRIILQDYEDEDMGMQVLVNLNFSDADSSKGNGHFQVQAIVTSKQDSTELEFELPPITEIQDYYHCWQDNYYNLIGQAKGFLPNETNVPSSIEECHRYVTLLRNQLNRWLLPVKSELEKVDFIQPNSEIYFFINNQKIASEKITEIIHKIPWREWNYFTDCDALEAVLSLHETESNTQTVASSVVDNGIFRRVRITSIFGDVKDIEEGVERDKEEIEKLEKRGAELIHLKQPQRPDLKKLWDEPCDIFFYSGHSNSEENSTAGRFKINKNDDLSLEEIRNTFREAIKKGLKIAIFNSCDGLGLACELAKLGLPYIIVWRESVPDKIAQKFIEYFLSSYSNGKSLFDSVRDARIKLKELTNKEDSSKQIPGLEWLPIICVSTKDEPPLWEDLGGLTGKLPDSPYRGLLAFGEEEKEYFFGRDKFVGELLEAVNAKSLVPIIGASGSGKSSVVFAGLVPRLREIGMQIVSFRPGNNPFDNLAVALKNLSNEKEVNNNHRLEELELEINLENDEQALCRLIEDLKTPSSQRFILIIDQFEELYTLTLEAQQQTFLNTLLYAVKHAPNFCLVFTLRADFYGYAISHREFSDALQQGIYNSSPMNEAELRTVIEQPAAKMKVKLESGLTDKLIDELGNQAGSLPLLEFTLLQLWEKHDRWFLTHQAYKEIGGLKQALAKYADGIINPLSAVDKEKAERIFIQLISPGEGTEDTKRKATCGEVGEENWDLVEELANQRLVVTGWDESSQQETVEIVHEALIREWGMLREWIQSNRRFRIWQERLQFEVVKWDKNREEKYLLSGGNLVEAEGWYVDEKYRDYLSDAQGKFIRESLEKRDKKIKEEKRKQRRTILGFTGFSVVSLVFAGFAGWNAIQANIGRIRSDALLTSINSERVSDQSPFQALLLSLKSGSKSQELGQLSSVRTDTPELVKKTLSQSISLVREQNHVEVKNSVLRYVTVSPDGQFIATGGSDNIVRIWDTKGNLIYALKGHSDGIWNVRFSPDGKTLASSSMDGTIRFWNVENGKFLKIILAHNNTEVRSISFSPDGKIIASSDSIGWVKLWNIANGKLIRRIRAHPRYWVTYVKFSPDGKTLASTSSDNTIKLWQVEDGQLLKTFKGHKGNVRTVDFSPNGKILASTSEDSTIKLWNIENGEELQNLLGHRSTVWGVDFSSDGKQLVSSGSDGTLKLWNLKTPNTPPQTFNGHSGVVRNVTFSTDGKKLFSVGDRTLRIWSLEDTEPKTLVANDGEVSAVSFSPDGKIIAAGTAKNIKLWNVENRKVITTLRGHKRNIQDISFSPNGKLLVSASSDRTVKLWDLENRKVIYSRQGHTTTVASISFSPDGKKFASASRDRTVKIWNVENGELLKTLKGHTGYAIAVSYSPDGKKLASAGTNSKVIFWDINNGRMSGVFDADIRYLDDLTFSPDSKFIATGGDQGVIKIWDIENRKELQSFEAHRQWIRSLRFSPDGKILASSSDDGTVKLWNVENGQLLRTMEGHLNKINQVSFSPDGKTIASASRDGTVKLWKLDLKLDDLMKMGCGWLQDYLTIHPEEEELREICKQQDLRN